MRRYVCADCCDSGMARFYYDPQVRERVWTVLEWEALPAEESEFLRVGSAVCDCAAGQRRAGRTVKTWRGERPWPLMEEIRALASQRDQVPDTSFDPSRYRNPAEPEYENEIKEVVQH